MSRSPGRPGEIAGGVGAPLHSDMPNEVADIPVKASPVGADILLLEDSEDNNEKKCATIASLPSDPTGDTLSQNSLITTTSTTHVLATGMTTTLPAGTYLVFWAATLSTDSTSDRKSYIQIYAGGAAQATEAETERGDSSTDNRIGCTCYARVTVNGSQAIEGRWRTEGSTGEMYNRNLAWIKVAA